MKKDKKANKFRGIVAILLSFVYILLILNVGYFFLVSFIPYVMGVFNESLLIQLGLASFLLFITFNMKYDIKKASDKMVESLDWVAGESWIW